MKKTADIFVSTLIGKTASLEVKWENNYYEINNDSNEKRPMLLF